MIRPIETLKGWFTTGSKPTQLQFWDWMDSFFHKNEGVSLNDVSGLDDALNGKANLQATQEQLNDINNLFSAHANNIRLHFNNLTDIDTVFGSGDKSGVYRDSSSIYIVSYTTTLQRTYQLQINSRGIIRVRSRGNSADSWGEWSNILYDLETKQVQIFDGSDYVNIDLFYIEENQSLIELSAMNQFVSQAIADALLAVQVWLPAVATFANLPTVVPDGSKNYLCRVITDPDASKNGVYQAIANGTTSPSWTLFSDNLDFVDENELGNTLASYAKIGSNLANALDILSADSQSGVGFDAAGAHDTTEGVVRQLAHQHSETLTFYRIIDYDNIEEQYGNFTVGEQLLFWGDEEPAILQVTEVDGNWSVVSLAVVAGGKYSWDPTGGWVDFYDGERYIYFSAIAEAFTEAQYTDLTDLENRVTAHENYTVNNYYTKAVVDSSFLRKNTSANITKYAGANQLQTRIDEVQKYLVEYKSANVAEINIYLQGDQTGNIYIQGFTGAAILNIHYQGVRTITGNVYVRGCTCHVRFVHYASGDYLNVTGNIIYYNCPSVELRSLRATNIEFENCIATLAGNISVPSVLKAHSTLLYMRVNLYSINVLTLQAASLFCIYESVNQDAIGGVQLLNGVIDDHRPGHPLDTFRRVAEDAKFLTEYVAGQEVNVRGNIYVQRFTGSFEYNGEAPLSVELLAGGADKILRIEGWVEGSAFGETCPLNYSSQDVVATVQTTGFIPIGQTGNGITLQYWSTANDSNQYDILIFYTK